MSPQASNRDGEQPCEDVIPRSIPRVQKFQRRLSDNELWVFFSCWPTAPNVDFV